MNKHIQQLAEQAGALVVKNVTNIPKAFSLNGEEIEKFAELIVKECLSVLEVHAWGAAYKEYVWCQRSTQLLKNHRRLFWGQR